MNYQLEVIPSIEHDEAWRRGIDIVQTWSLNPDQADQYWLAHIPECYTAGLDLRKTELPADINGVPVHRTVRGGGLTYYSTGQLHVCTLVDLQRLGYDLPEFMHRVLRSVTAVLQQHTHRLLRYQQDDAGIFTDSGEKVASLGFHVRDGKVIGGLVINYCANLAGFAGLMICGQQRSMANLSDTELSWNDLVIRGQEIVTNLTQELYHDQQNGISPQGT